MADPAAVSTLPVPSPAKGARGRAKNAPKSYVASINGRPLPVPFATSLLALEKNLRMPLWFIIQQGSSRGRLVQWEDLADDIVAGFRASRSEIPRGKPIALLIDSPGGYAEPAYTLARILN